MRSLGSDLFNGNPGDCLLIETNKDAWGHYINHLFVVVTESEEHTRNVVIVNIESVKPKCDTTVILRAGDHEFIQRDSFVNYRRARIVSLEDLFKLINNKTAVAKKPFKDDVLNKIISGISRSKFTPNEVIDFYQNSLYSF